MCLEFLVPEKQILNLFKIFVPIFFFNAVFDCLYFSLF